MNKFKSTRKVLFAAFLATIIVGGGAISVLASTNATVGQDINAMLSSLKLAGQQAVKAGQTTKDQYGNLVYTGSAATSIKSMEDAYGQQIDTMLARTPDQRAGAISAIEAFSGQPASAIVYSETIPSSYNTQLLEEVYVVGSDQYEVSTVNNQIIQFGPRPLLPGEATKTYSSGNYSVAQLKTMAMQKIANTVNVDLTKLTASTGSKVDNEFFRWEDGSRTVEGMHPFIQIGISSGGDIESYTNTLSL